MMLTEWIGQSITYFPLVIFVGLVLGGFNLPISEDVLVIMAAILCHQNKTAIPEFYAALYFGAILSDYLVYFWGVLFRNGSTSIRFVTKFVKEENTRQMSQILEKYGILTYLIGRFVPFGIRNIISLTSGFIRFPFYKFAIFDAIAAFCNISVLFWLVYFMGEKGGFIMKIAGVGFLLIFIGLTVYVLYKENLIGTKKHKQKQKLRKH